MQQSLETIAQLTQRVQDVEARLVKDSHNSHLPPSFDRFSRQPKSLRKKSGKSSGGQKGHPGQHLRRVQTPDQILIHAPERCTWCFHDLQDQPAETRLSRHFFDLPLPHIIVSEHQVLKKRCLHCHNLTSAHFSDDVQAPVQYGPSIAAIAVALSQQHLLPDQRVCQILKDVLGVCISSGSLHTWIARAAQQFHPIEEQIKTALQQVAVLHQDETGLYVSGKRHWMHVACTTTLTHYGVHARQGREAMDAIGIAPHFMGISVHDGWASYHGYRCRHALCNVHHLRELTFLEEEHQQEWAKQIKELLWQMHESVASAKQAGQSCLSPAVIAHFRAGYEAWLRQAESLHPPDPPLAGTTQTRHHPLSH